MKKSLIVTSVALGCIGLSAFGLMNWTTPKTIIKEVKEKTPTCAQATSECGKVTDKVEIIETVPQEQDFYIGVGTRFGGFTKSDIQKAQSFADFMNEDELKVITDVKSIKVIVIKDDEQTDQRLFVEGNLLSTAQKTMMRNFDYSTNFLVSADCIRKNLYTGEQERSQYRPHLTVVPDVQAQYDGGFENLVSYFRDNSAKEVKKIDSKKLTPAKIYFTVTKEGDITNVKLDHTTSFSDIDDKMVQLVQDMPRNWTPAQDEKGENIDQVLICTFGVMGC